MNLERALSVNAVNAISKPDLGQLVKFYGSRTSYELEFGNQTNPQLRTYDNEEEFVAAVDILVNSTSGANGGQSNSGILRTNALRLENFYNELAMTADEVVDILVGEFNCTATDIVTKAQEIKAEVLALTGRLDQEKEVSEEAKTEVIIQRDTIRNLTQQIEDLRQSGGRTGQTGGQTGGQSGGQTDTNGVNDKEMLNLLLPLLKGQALHMVKNAKQLDPNINWSTFRKQLLTCFKTETNERRLIKEFNELKQKGNFDEFINKLMDISTQLPMISVDEKRRTFIKALKPNIQFELLKSNVNDLDEVIRVARIYEECHSSSDHKRNDHGDLKKVNFAKTHFPKRFNFKEKNFTKIPFKGGLSQNGQKFEKSSSNPLKKNDITCFKCKKKDHVSKFCKVKVHQVNTIDVQEDDDDDEEA
jgi:hypothetical protein